MPNPAGLMMDELHERSLWAATAPLPAGLRTTILPERQAASDTWRLLRYFRLDAAGRLLMGARGTFGSVPLRTTARPHRRAIREIYPQLHDLPCEFQWGGLVAITPDHLPHVHELAPGLRAALGYNGRGVAMATVMGRILARWVLGEAPEASGFPRTPLRPIPLHGLSQIATRVAIHSLRALDSWEGARVAAGRPRT
jgi:glycine/D-amino acid oxidase-like deaminating enzyme